MSDAKLWPGVNHDRLEQLHKPGCPCFGYACVDDDARIMMETGHHPSCGRAVNKIEGGTDGARTGDVPEVRTRKP